MEQLADHWLLVLLVTLLEAEAAASWCAFPLALLLLRAALDMPIASAARRWCAAGGAWLILSSVGLFGLSPWLIAQGTRRYDAFPFSAPPDHAWLYGLQATGTVVVVFLIDRYVHPAVNAWQARRARTTALQRDGKSDIRHIRERLPRAGIPYDPRQYFRQGQIFVGLSADRTPICVPYPVFREAHVGVAGTTGTGKGVLSSLLVTQALLHGEAIFVLDPKFDAWAPHVLASMARQYGIPYVFINLRPGNSAQVNFLAGASPDEVAELLYAGFSLGERGEAADYYRLHDRRAARLLAREARGQTPRELYARLQSNFDKAPYFAGLLEEMAELESVNAAHGVDLRGVFQQGGVVYVVGSMRHPTVIRMQRMLLVRLIQLAEQRPRTGALPRSVSILADEFRFHVSRPALEALATARDKQLHLITTYQSITDLHDTPADLPPEVCSGTLTENTAIKAVYRLQDAATAKAFSALSGTILVDEETRWVRTNWAGGEEVLPQRSLKQSETYLVPENALLQLPPGVAMLSSPDGVQYVHVSPIPVAKDVAHITPTHIELASPKCPESGAAALIDV